ncbi:efflux RND transporter periplasmic adaptor subunit [Paractinoplanes rishiriensis]|uniref:Uncharacterized protein n=1 Tax=Paractinoplanes rishiriensis TaxID=1050105 RepID=A0A919MY65_9ACTN|nr:hypothetical protein [Actinoplanes rishiriensis]GIE96620.1 hypothetical protein Ari01nite_40850 [Actinoplanes rishiriensis]
MSTGRWITAGVALAGVGLAGLFWSRSASGEAPAPAAVSAATVEVRQGALSGQVNQTGTLSYAARADGSDYPIVNQASGLYTKLPAAGQVIGCGQVLYWVDDDPVLLLCGNRPLYRDLYEGREGWDVALVNRALSLDGDEFTWETGNALAELQEDRGAEETGTLRVGAAVVLPGPVRIAEVTATLGTRAQPGGRIGAAVTTARQVVVELNASQQAQVKVGNRARITLPDNRVTAGRVSRIGAVATAGKEGEGATVPVYLTLDQPREAGALDAAPVRVRITTAGVKDALIVPVTALIGVDGGGFGVERVTAAGVRETVPVKLGQFDDAAGMVQVTGPLAVGDRVVVPSS